MNHEGLRQYRTRAPRKYRLGHHMMTRAEATEIRSAHLNGKEVLALELQEACRILSRERRPKVKLPLLTAVQRERVNAVLLFNLGRALGRFDERKAA